MALDNTTKVTPYTSETNYLVARAMGMKKETSLFTSSCHWVALML